MREKEFSDWLQEGINLGFVGPAICYTHDGIPSTESEDGQFDEGADPCMHILRLYEDLEMKKAIEENHSPSVWRASNAGFDLNVRKG
jgi:hypothetical protein